MPRKFDAGPTRPDPKDAEMLKKLPKANRLARERVMAKISVQDFAAMSQSRYADWINGLPVLEFMALIDLHAEGVRKAYAEADPEPEYVSRYTADDPTGGWTDCGAQQPVADSQVVWVTFSDGEIGGPDRADAFSWDGELIVSYAVAVNPKLREAGDDD